MKEEGRNWFVRRNIGYRLLALLLAILLWYFVTGQRDPIVDRTFTRPVEGRFLSTQMVLTSTLPEVKVTVRGLHSLIQAMSEDDIDAYIDLSGRSDGVSFVPVRVKVPSGIQLVKVEPDTIRVSLDYLEEKRVPVRVSATGEPAPGFTLLTPEVTPDHVVIRGPGRVLSGIQDVRASLNVTGARESVSQKVRLRVAQKSDRQLEIRPDTVEVTVPVVSQWPIRSVSVFADLQGKPKTGFKVGGVSIEPAEIQITGPPQSTGNLSQVLTKPVDINGADDKVIKEVGIALPAGVYTVNVDKVKVAVDIVREETGQLSNE